MVIEDVATILIVDDLPANRDFLVALLRHQGHQLLQAGDGREGLAAVRTGHPDLVITDVLMPVMDGYEFVKQLRLDPTTSKTPVVFYTADYGAREARALALASGVAYVITKPVASAAVLAIVGRALSGQSETGTPPDDALAPAFDREHLRLVTDKLSEKADDLRAANTRLRALINIGLEVASERDPDRLLQRACVAAHDLFGATYVTLGIVDLRDRTVQRIASCGTPADWIKVGDSVSGVLGTVVAERRTMRGDNRRADPAVPGFSPLHPEVHAFLAAPVASPAQVYGWFCLVGNEGRTFSEDDEDLVMALSGQIGRIYENTRFQEIAANRTRALEAEIVVREQAESALRHARDRAQRYLDAAEVILLALDLDGYITLINRKGCDLLGWTEEELLGRNWIETCLPQRSQDACRPMFRRLIVGQLPINENPIVTKSGEERLIEWRNTMLRDDGGRVIGTLSSGADVTERHEAVEALRAAEERMRFALEAAGVGIWDMDFATGSLQWSAILESQYGLKPGAFAGTFEAFLEHVHPDDRAAVAETMAKANRSGADFTLQHRALWADGTVRWLSGAGRIRLGEHGEPVRGVGVSMDVTERSRLEEQYQQAQKMEAIGRLAGGVAHDFNNLLTAILGYCELLLDDLPADDRSRNDVGEIRKAGISAAALTRQLLSFSRKEIIEPTVLDLNVVVTDMTEMLGRLIGEDVTVVLGLGPGVACVKTDRGQAEQIVMNLAVNARDAMPKGGTLTIETANVDLDERYARTHLSVTPGPYVALTVTDTGTGMTPEVLARLFEPFFTTKERGKGTGLGLATVHGIVTRSGGSVTVASEAGHGSSFKVYFPQAKAADLAVEAPPPVVRPHGGGETVLLVDDAEGLRALARRLLERHGYKALIAASADEALRLFEENAAIDVVLTDVVMPGASGPELVRQLVEQRPGLKVIYMSGYTEDAIVHHGVLEPGIAFLHKPFTSDTLGEKIRETLDR